MFHGGLTFSPPLFTFWFKFFKNLTLLGISLSHLVIHFTPAYSSLSTTILVFPLSIYFLSLFPLFLLCKKFELNHYPMKFIPLVYS